MRVVAPRSRAAVRTRPGGRSAHLELLGLLAATMRGRSRPDARVPREDGRGGRCWGRRRGCVVRQRNQPAAAAGARRPHAGPRDVRVPFRAARGRRRTVPARSRHAVPLEHVGGLVRVTIPATEIRADRRYVQLRSRLERRPWLEGVPVLSPADLANLKPHVVVRTPEAFRLRLMTAALCLFAAFWTAHAFRRMRGTIGDPVALPVVLLLCGIGLMSLVALRDPLRDTMSFFTSVTGIVAGAGVAGPGLRGRPGGVAAAPRGARATRRWLSCSQRCCCCSAPGRERAAHGCGCSGSSLRTSSGCSWCSRSPRTSRDGGEFLREYSQEPTPSRPWLRHVNVPRWKDVGPAIVSLGIVVAFFFLQRDLGPALVLSCVFLGMYGVARHRGVLVVGRPRPRPLRIRSGVLDRHPGHGAAARGDLGESLEQWRARRQPDRARPVGAGDGLGVGQRARAGKRAVVPAGDTDFVLTIAGEELGFVGVAVLVALYALLCWRCLRVAVRAPGDYTALLALGVALDARRAGLRDRERRARTASALGRGHAVSELRAVGDARQLPRARGRAGDRAAARARSAPQLQAAVRVVCAVLARCRRGRAGPRGRGFNWWQPTPSRRRRA